MCPGNVTRMHMPVVDRNVAPSPSSSCMTTGLKLVSCCYYVLDYLIVTNSCDANMTAAKAFNLCWKGGRPWKAFNLPLNSRLIRNTQEAIMIILLCKKYVGIEKALAERAATRKLDDLTIGPVLTWPTKAILEHVDKLLKIPGSTNKNFILALTLMPLQC